jgi:hypothetical protein
MQLSTHLVRVRTSQVFTLQRNTMQMKILLVVTYPFLHRGAQLLVVARATTPPQKKGRLTCYTHRLT